MSDAADEFMCEHCCQMTTPESQARCPVKGCGQRADLCDPLSDPRVAALVEAVEAAMECRMIPSSTAADGGANRHVKAVHVADQLRAALAALRQPD